MLPDNCDHITLTRAQALALIKQITEALDKVPNGELIDILQGGMATSPIELWYAPEQGCEIDPDGNVKSAGG